MKILVVSDFDSRIKWGIALASRISTANSIEVVIDPVERQSCARELNLAGKVYETIDPIAWLAEADVTKYQITIIALGGRANVKAIYAMHSRFSHGAPRPLIIGGFNGVTDRNDPDAILTRVGMDLVFINCDADKSAFSTTLERLNADSPSLAIAGYLRHYPEKSADNFSRCFREILFVQQPGIPGSAKAFKYLIEELISYKLRNPEVRLKIKLRDEHSRGPNKSLLKYSAKKITQGCLRASSVNGVMIDDSPIEDLIIAADEVWSVSSTALMEAISLGKKVLCIADFGIGKAYGNQYFVGSGLFRVVGGRGAIQGELSNEAWRCLNVPEALTPDQVSQIVAVALLALQHAGYRKKRAFYSNSPWLQRNRELNGVGRLGRWFSRRVSSLNSK